MRKILFFLFTTSTLLISSCRYFGGDIPQKASANFNDSAWLVSKGPTDYDYKFGYEVKIYNYDSSEQKRVYKEVWIPKSIYNKIPEDSEKCKIKILYIQNIEYGEKLSDVGTIWDNQSNLCIDFEKIPNEKK